MVNDRVKKLRTLMQEQGLDAYLILSTDPHQSEYLPPHWNRVPFISGFTGTYCNIAITQTDAMLWTDGKEELKVKSELKGSLYEFHVKDYVTSDLAMEVDWLSQKLPKKAVLGLDPQTITVNQMTELQNILNKKDIKISYTVPNLVDLIWDKRPSLSTTPISLRNSEFEPVTREEKINRIQVIMSQNNIDVLITSNLESIARVLNVRGNDIQYNPLVISYLIVTKDNAHWFVDKNRIRDTLSTTIMDYKEFPNELKKISAGKTVLIDPNEASQWILNCIDPTATIIKAASPLNEFKSIKTKAEMKNMMNASLKDSVALIKAIYWVKDNIKKNVITEWDVMEKVLEYKQQENGFLDLSFETICAYGKNAAIIHYSPTKEKALSLKNKGLLLIDAGGHYLDGTSDITRTISLGPVTKEMKQNYTRVLKGHLSVANAKFPKGTRGYHLDPYARRPLWDAGLNFYHGTGHGVGYCTCVHETSGIGISLLRPAILDEGMVLTNEPGYYKEGGYGMRIENCVYVSKNEKLSKINGKNPVLEFKDLTMCPYERTLIDKTMLCKEEIKWINDYHKLVYKTVISRIKDKKILAWLKTACAAI